MTNTDATNADTNATQPPTPADGTLSLGYHTRMREQRAKAADCVGRVDLGERASFADVGATAAEALGAVWHGQGQSFWRDLLGC